MRASTTYAYCLPKRLQVEKLVASEPKLAENLNLNCYFSGCFSNLSNLSPFSSKFARYLNWCFEAFIGLGWLRLQQSRHPLFFGKIDC